jgi:abortive infection bacteriophage resistance protein
MIENNIKSIMSYQLSKKYGYRESDYLNPKNFNLDGLKTSQIRDVLNKMKRQIKSNVGQHQATIHYANNYGYIPMWIMVKVLSFGIMTELYNILKDEDKQAIADIYKIAPNDLSTYLLILSNYRNLCAHEEILYDHRTQKQIDNTKYHRLLNIPMTDDEYIYGKNDLYSVIIIMKEMLTDTEFRNLIREIGYEIDILAGKTSTVPIEALLNKIGFPENWQDILDINK